jgi:hypothetical protein
MITIQTRVTVDEQGVTTVRLPPGIAPGEHEIVLVIGEAPAARQTPIMAGFPRHDVKVDLPEGFTFRREDMYDDSGRGAWAGVRRHERFGLRGRPRLSIARRRSNASHRAGGRRGVPLDQSWIVDVSALLSRFQVVEDGPAVTSALLTILAAVPCGEKQVYDANIVATMTTRSIRRLLTHNVSDFVRFSTWVDILPLYNFARSEECPLSGLDPLLLPRPDWLCWLGQSLFPGEPTMTSVYSVIHDPVQDSWSIHSHRVVRLTEARVGIEDGLWLNRIEMEKDGRTASGHVVFYKDRRDAEDFCRKQALTG